ncbi:indolepyruvate ferredoxin oxidoreductase, alpha subunit [Dehalogenimonas lykanthroporepellens BL-DC-9]|nr:indolepyruvate ferredoxin oxidoreductase, alpha subunit [Dehalogenimonas lykanthroporepellens BL-DC-9]
MDRQLLSGNEAIALGAAHAGMAAAATYPGTPSTEILEAVARFPGIYIEWTSKEAVEVSTGFWSTRVRGWLVIIAADNPGIPSSQNEQCPRNYA